MRPPAPFNGVPIHLSRPSPAFRAAEDNHRPPRFGDGLTRPSCLLDLPDFGQGPLHRRSHVVVNCFVRLGVGRVASVLDDPDLVAVAGEEAGELEVVHGTGDGAFSNLQSAMMRESSPCSRWRGG